MADTLLTPTGTVNGVDTQTTVGFVSGPIAGDGAVTIILQIYANVGALNVTSEGVGGSGSGTLAPLDANYQLLDTYTAPGIYYIKTPPTLFRFKVNTGTGVIIKVTRRSITDAVKVQDLLNTPVSTGSTTLPRYTGGTIGNLVVLINGVWVDGNPLSMRQELDGPKGIIGTDNQVYPMGAAVPITGSSQPVNTDLMLKAASSAGQPNLEAVPQPYPPAKDPSSSFTVVMPGRVSSDGTKIITNASTAAIYVNPVGELGEYDFVNAGTPTLLPDLSGSGYPLTVADSGGIVYTARGLQMTATTTLTSPASTVTPSLSIIIGFRRLNASANHALFSNPGIGGPLWQLGGSDQTVWADTSDSAPGITALSSTSTIANKVYGITINGLTVTYYENGTLFDTKTLVKPFSVAGLIKPFAGNGNPFIGEAMYFRILSVTMTGAEHASAAARASAKMSGRP